MAKWKGFCGPSYTPASKIAAYDESVNIYCERVESGTGNDGAQYTMYQANGFSTAVTVVDSPGRGGIPQVSTITGPSSTATNAFYIVGETLYEFPDTLRGAGLNQGGDAPAQMIWNGVQGHQILIADGSVTWCYDTTSHVMTNVGVGQSIGFLNGYGLRLNSAASQVDFSAPFDMSSWAALDTFIREDASDKWLRLIVYHNEIWLFGEVTTSIYTNTDSATTPFVPIKSAFMTTGIYARHSACIVGGTLMWIGRDVGGSAVVYRANGYNAERISTHAVEASLQGHAGLTLTVDAEGTYYQTNGHDFYELTLPSQEGGVTGFTWVYDATEGLWHKRGQWTGLEYMEMDTRGYFDGYTLSRTSGKVYAVQTDPESAFTYIGTDGLGIRWMRRAPHLSDENKGCIIDSVELKFQPGGVTSLEPHFTLSFSRNGGQTWSNAQTVSAGLTGEYDTRAIWEQLGYGRDRLIEITGSDACFTPIIDAYVNARTGRN